MRLFCFIFSSLLAASAAYADGLIVEKSRNGIVFHDAISVNINDKDKALNLGSQPKLSGPANKLPQVRLSATLIKDTRSGTVVLYGEGQPQYLLPQGVPKNTQPNPADVWKSARITYRKSQSEKTPVELPVDGFLAFLPDGLSGLISLCMDPGKLALIGGNDGYFPAQIEIVAATVKAYGSDPAMASIDRYIRDTMRVNSERFDDGVDSAKSLDQGLQFAKLSEQAYPADPAHQQLRKGLAERKAWLDRRMAILKSLYVASEWDAFLLSYRDFEKHQKSFADFRDRRTQALTDSLKTHWGLGKERMARREYGSAYRELKLASVRDPANPALQKDVSVAWSEYSREVAGSSRVKRIPLTPGQQDAVTQAIHFATRYREQNKLDEALKSVREGEAVDSENLGLLLKKAEIYAARGEFREALLTLDKYDTIAVDDERAPGTKLRNEVAFQVLNVLHEQKSAMESGWARQQYNRTRRIALDALRADNRDPDVLYFAGLSSLVTRDPEAGRKYLTQFLELSNTVNANDERRMTALRLLSTPQPAPAKASTDTGDPNWFSGKRLPAGIAYCPISLAFGPHVERIDASNKLTVQYEWNGSSLRTIVPSFDKPQNSTGEVPIAFTYEDTIPQVIAVEAQGGLPFTASADRDELLRKATVVLINSPLIDPVALERVTGKKVTIVSAGNRYFHPFVWQKLHYFQLSYDDAERVRSAREITGPDASGGGETDLEFDWDGQRLMEIRGYARADESHRSPIYERRQQYDNGRLVGEEIKANGKVSRIKYVYEGSTLVSAHCDKDETVDNRSREVFFVAARSRRR